MSKLIVYVYSLVFLGGGWVGEGGELMLLVHMQFNFMYEFHLPFKSVIH